MCINNCPLIFQTIGLPELAPHQSSDRLPRLHRAGPSTSPDKSAIGAILLECEDHTTFGVGVSIEAKRVKRSAILMPYRISRRLNEDPCTEADKRNPHKVCKKKMY